ncbi:hypothetical protein D3C84_935190 [compost metagenome]
MIQPVTVGMVKYPTIPIIIKMIYTVFEVSGMKVGSDSISISRSNIRDCIRASIELKRSATGSQR